VSKIGPQMSQKEVDANFRQMSQKEVDANLWWQMAIFGFVFERTSLVGKGDKCCGRKY
jgi:hypothetical protein